MSGSRVRKPVLIRETCRLRIFAESAESELDEGLEEAAGKERKKRLFQRLKCLNQYD